MKTGCIVLIIVLSFIQGFLIDLNHDDETRNLETREWNCVDNSTTSLSSYNICLKTADTTNTTGYYFMSLLYDIYEIWGIVLDQVVIITDLSDNVLGESILSNLKDGTSVSFIVRDSKSNMSDRGGNFIVVGNLSFIESTLQKATAHNLLAASTVWVTLTTESELEPIDTGSSNSTFIQVFKSTTARFDLRISKGVDFSEALWYSNSCLRYTNESKSGTFKNIYDVIESYKPQLSPSLRISVIHVPPYIFKDTKIVDTRYSGYLIDIFDKLSESLNFSYTLQECSEGGYGVWNKTSWTGCIGDVVSRKSDVILAPLAVTTERCRAVDFITPYIGVSGLQVLRKKKTVDHFFVLDIFTGYVWMACVSVVSCTSISLYVFHKYRPQEASSMNIPKTTEVGVWSEHPSFVNSTSLGDTVWFVISSVCFQGVDDNWLFGSGRVLVAGFWIFCTVIMACFTANMAAFLTNIRLEEDDPGTVTERLDNTLVNFTVVKDSPEHVYIKTVALLENYYLDIWKSNMYTFSTGEANTVWSFPLESKFSKLLENLEKHPLPTSIQSALNLVKDNFELILDSNIATYYSHIDCSLRLSTNPKAQHPISIAVSKGSKYRNMLSESLLDLQQSHEFDKFKRKWWQEETKCIGENVNDGLSLYRLRAFYYLVAFGIFVSFVILLGEVIFVKLKIMIQKHRRKTKSSVESSRETICTIEEDDNDKERDVEYNDDDRADEYATMAQFNMAQSINDISHINMEMTDFQCHQKI